MFDPLLTLIAAKTKAVGLVAGTAMVTTALVGGGAVAMTAVSDETAVVPEAAVVLEDTTTAPADQQVVEAAPAATPTVGIEEPETEPVDEPEKVRPPLPADFTCDDTKNHGQNVSAYAKGLPKGPGRGEKVSAVAQSDCGKKSGEEAESTESEEAEVEDAESEVETETDEVEEPARAEKPTKKAKKAKPAKAAKSKK